MHQAGRSGAQAPVNGFPCGKALSARQRCLAGRAHPRGLPSWPQSSPASSSSCCTPVGDDLEQRVGNLCRKGCTCCTKLRRAGPDHLLIGTVALYRTGNRSRVPERHFCQPGAPRVRRGRDLACSGAAGGPAGTPRGHSGHQARPPDLAGWPWAAGHAHGGLREKR